MSLRSVLLSAGDLRGTVYTFEKAGDTLPMHAHTDADVHITIVARGSVRVYGPTIGETVHQAGAVISFEASHPHEIVALADESRIVNIIKRHQIGQGTAS